MKTIRLKIPQWQGGNKPSYAFGADLLAWLVPQNQQQQEFEIDISTYTKPLEKENGVMGQSIVMENLDKTVEIIESEQPDKIITLGGDCLVSQAPFDYLKGKYGDELGVIWIDAHPDISTPEIYHHEHAMVLGNLLHQGDPILAKKVKYPLKVQDILYVGLQEPTNDEKIILEKLGLDYQIQTKKRLSPNEIKNWLYKNKFSKTIVHLDLDVLDPNVFRSLYFTESGVNEFPSESGKMSLSEVQQTLQAISDTTEIMGLTIAEYLPWDAENLKNLLEKMNIFK